MFLDFFSIETERFLKNSDINRIEINKADRFYSPVIWLRTPRSQRGDSLLFPVRAIKSLYKCGSSPASKNTSTPLRHFRSSFPIHSRFCFLSRPLSLVRSLSRSLPMAPLSDPSLSSTREAPSISMALSIVIPLHSSLSALSSLRVRWCFLIFFFKKKSLITRCLRVDSPGSPKDYPECCLLDTF